MMGTGVYLIMSSVSGAMYGVVMYGAVLSIPVLRTRRRGWGTFIGMSLVGAMGMAGGFYWGIDDFLASWKLIAPGAIVLLPWFWEERDIVFISLALLALFAAFLWWASSPARRWHLLRFRSSADMPGRRET
ncbi:MAG: hypothetical protein FD149_2674 [Rhodospirillaceae bacterium]|nr:MAG: hypothetical protein FD149_2674 [Rhodospirillaceae bacterium]